MFSRLLGVTACCMTGHLRASVEICAWSIYMFKCLAGLAWAHYSLIEDAITTLSRPKIQHLFDSFIITILLTFLTSIFSQHLILIGSPHVVVLAAQKVFRSPMSKDGGFQFVYPWEVMHHLRNERES